MPNGKSKFDIYERIFNFIVQVLAFIDKLPNTYSSQVIKNQITRSVTSMELIARKQMAQIVKKIFFIASPQSEKRAKKQFSG